MNNTIEIPSKCNTSTKLDELSLLKESYNNMYDERLESLNKYVKVSNDCMSEVRSYMIKRRKLKKQIETLDEMIKNYKRLEKDFEKANIVSAHDLYQFALRRGYTIGRAKDYEIEIPSHALDLLADRLGEKSKYYDHIIVAPRSHFGEEDTTDFDPLYVLHWNYSSEHQIDLVDTIHNYHQCGKEVAQRNGWNGWQDDPVAIISAWNEKFDLVVKTPYPN